MSKVPNDPFFSSLPVFTRFEGVADAGNYKPLPDDWVLAVADIVGSTKAIEQGHYKSVNMAGASVISAVLNALDGDDYPFVFGGDGAMVALPGSRAEAARAALAAVRGWVLADLELELRVALVPVTDIRAEGLDVRVARYSASPFVSYAMFTGGGASWAEAQMKAGKYGIAAAAPEERPDLTGLSCRWNPIHAQNGEIVSIIAKPTSPETMAEFRDLVEKIVAITAEQNRDGHPVPADGPELAFSLDGVAQEARASVPKGRRLLQRLTIGSQIALTVLLHKLNLKLGRFDARRYKRDVASNSDFRKFDDGLKMTVDVNAANLTRIEVLLEDGERRGICEYGIHRQDSALMTCFVLTPMTRDHMHFIDGASGGYAVAASRLAGKRPGSAQALSA